MSVANGRHRIVNNFAPTPALVAQVRELLRRAILTMVSLPDPDARFQPIPGGWDVVQGAEAYGYTPAKFRIRPSSADITLLDTLEPWLSWIRRTLGQPELDRLVAWSLGTPVWKIARREGRSERTIYNRIDRTVAAAIEHHANASIRVEIVDEPLVDERLEAVICEKPPGPHGVGDPILKKVYIGELGFFVINGRRWSTGIEKYDMRQITR